MIDFINGLIKKKTKDYIILNSNDIGYKLLISYNCSKSLPLVGEKVSVLVYLHVRENILDLYGFIDQNERDSFNLLISVSGIGPKLALTILSGLKSSDLKDYIIEGDVKSLTSIQGVGAKTAKRMIIDLKEKYINIGEENLGLKEEKIKNTKLYENVLNALISLGFKKNQVKNVCNKMVSNGELEGDIELIIKKALTHLMS